MSSNTQRLSLLVACLLALGLFAAPTGVTTSTDDAFDVAARAELGPNGREVQLASRGTTIGTGRADRQAPLRLAAGARPVHTGRSAQLT